MTFTKGLTKGTAGTRGLRVLAAAAVAGALAVTAAACDSDTTGTASGVTETTVPPQQARASSPSADTTTPQAVPTAPAEATPVQEHSGDGQDSGIGPCRTNGLEVTKGRTGGAAGSRYIPIVFTNTSGDTCTITGFPGVSYVDASGDQVGAAADRDPTAPHTVTLAPGEVASAMVRAAVVQNYPAQLCRPTAVSGLKIYPPNNTAAVVLDDPTTGCQAEGDRVHQLSVKPVVPGPGR